MPATYLGPLLKIQCSIKLSPIPWMLNNCLLSDMFIIYPRTTSVVGNLPFGNCSAHDFLLNCIAHICGFGVLKAGNTLPLPGSAYIVLRFLTARRHGKEGSSSSSLISIIWFLSSMYSCAIVQWDHLHLNQGFGHLNLHFHCQSLLLQDTNLFHYLMRMNCWFSGNRYVN